MSKIKFSIFDTLIVSFLFIFVVSFPFDYFSSFLPTYGILLLKIIFRIFLLGYSLKIIIQNNISFGKINFRNIALFIPFLIACFTNLISVLFNNSYIFTSSFDIKLFLEIIIVILTAINEEIVFRLFVYNSLKIQNRLLKILAGAAIFGAFHLLNLISPSFVTLLPIVLLQSVYTFGLGLILCFIYEFGFSLIPCIIYHFIFNFFNQLFVTKIMIVYQDNYAYIIIAVVVSLVLATYGLLLYFLKFKKENNSLSSNQYFD